MEFMDLENISNNPKCSCTPVSETQASTISDILLQLYLFYSFLFPLLNYMASILQRNEKFGPRIQSTIVLFLGYNYSYLFHMQYLLHVCLKNSKSLIQSWCQSWNQDLVIYIRSNCGLYSYWDLWPQKTISDPHKPSIQWWNWDSNATIKILEKEKCEVYRRHWSIAVLKTRQVLPGPPNLREGIFHDLLDFGSVFLGVAAQAAVLYCCWRHTPGGSFSSLFFFFCCISRGR